MVVFTLGSDSGFQIGADGILDDYDDEGGISVVLWCIIFVFLLVVTIWFYITQLSPGRSAKCVDDEGEDEEERVANKLLNHLTGKGNSKKSAFYEEHDVCRPSTSRENLNNYEVIDGEIRIHHSNYEWQNEPSSRGNETTAKVMSDALVRRPSMEEMSLIFPGVLASIKEEDEDEDEEEENKEKNKEKELFNVDVCKIRDLEGDTVECCPNISSDSHVYEASPGIYNPENTENPIIDHEEDYSTFNLGKNSSGRQLTNRKGKMPALNTKVTEIRLRSNYKEIERTEKISEVHAVQNNNDKSRTDKKSQEFVPAGSGGKENDFNENKFSVSGLEKTSHSSQNTTSFISISGLKAHNFDPAEQNIVSNSSNDYIQPQKEATPADQRDFKADTSSSELREDPEDMLPISASVNSNCYVKKAYEDSVCIETTNAVLQSGPDRSLGEEEENNGTKNDPFAGSLSKENNELLSNDLSNSKFKGSNNMSDQLKHSWTFYSMSETTNNEIHNDNQNAKTLVTKQDQSQEIPQIVVDSYEETKKISDVNNFVNDTWPQLNEQIDCFETDIDVDDLDLDLEQENELDGTEQSEFNLFLKRHVSVTDLDKILSSTEVFQDENHASKKFENERAKENNLETVEHGINISSANSRVYTESSLDDIWDDYECPENNNTLMKDVRHKAEMSEETSHSSENSNYDVRMRKDDFYSRQTVWTTLDQASDSSKVVGESKEDLVSSSTENKNKEKVFEVIQLPKKGMFPVAKGNKNIGKTIKNVNSDLNPDKNKHSVRETEEFDLDKKIPEIKKGSEEENILRTPININEFSAITELSEGKEYLNKFAQSFKEEKRSNKTDELELSTESEILELLSSKNNVYCPNNRRKIDGKPENASEICGAGENNDHEVLIKRAKAGGSLEDSSPSGEFESAKSFKVGVTEKTVPEGSENKGFLAKNSKEMSRKDIVLAGRKENKERVVRQKFEPNSSKVGIILPVSANKRDDIIYGRRKLKKDNNGKRADFILNLNARSRVRENVTSPYTSESDDSDALRNVTQHGKKDVTTENKETLTLLLSEQTYKDGVNSGENLSRGKKEGKEEDITPVVTHSYQTNDSSTVPNLDKEVSDGNVVIDNMAHDTDFVTQEKNACTLNVTQSSDIIEPEVSGSLESAQTLYSGETRTVADAGATEKGVVPDMETLISKTNDSQRNCRVERRDVQPKFEKSIVLDPEKKQLQTLITIDQVPDTHIGLKICMTGRFDVAEQNRPITGLEKAEQIVANRLRRIEAEKKAAEEKEREKMATDRDIRKETRQRKDYSTRAARYDETRYRRTNQGRTRGLPVDEVITSEESKTRQFQWSDFKLNDVVLEETEVTDKSIRVGDISDDFDLVSHQEKPNIIKKFQTTNEIIKENVTSETFSPREVDWSLLELDYLKNKNTEKAGKAVADMEDRKPKGKIVSGLLGDSSVNKINDKTTKISLEKDIKDDEKDGTKDLAVEELKTKTQKKIAQKHSFITTESNTSLKKEKEIKQKQYNKNRYQIGLDRKKRSDVLKKEICDELSNMNIEMEEPDKKANEATSLPSKEPEFPVRQTKSFSELRSITRENNELKVDVSKRSDGLSEPSTPKELGPSVGLEDEVFSDSPSERVFKTKVTVDEVRGNKRTITILNIRKKSPGSSRWKSLNDIDTLSTVQKQVIRFRSISSQSDDDQKARVKPDSSQSREHNETIFAVSGLSPTEELDTRAKEEETKPITSNASLQVNQERPFENDKSQNTAITTYMEQQRTKTTSLVSSEAPQQKSKENSRSRFKTPEENAVSPSRRSPASTSSHNEKRMEGKISPIETVFVASAHSPTHSSDTGYNSKEEEKTVQRQPSLSPVTVKESQRSTSGTMFALSRHSPTPLSDLESKAQEKFVQRQSSISPVTVQTSRGSTNGTIFALSRHSPTPLSDAENENKEKKYMQRQSSLSPVTVPPSRSSSTGRIFALSRHSPTRLSDAENKTKGERTVSRQSPLTLLEKQQATERSSRYGVKSGKGTFFAVSRYSPATSDSENQGPVSTSRPSTDLHHLGTRSSKDSVAPVRSLVESENKFEDANPMYQGSPALEVKPNKDGLNRRYHQGQTDKVNKGPGKSKVHEEINEKRKEGERKSTEHYRQNETISSRNTLTKLRSPGNGLGKKSTSLEGGSDNEYRITRDGWLEKVSDSSSLSSSDDQQRKIVKVTDLDSLLGGVTSSPGGVVKEETKTAVSSITTGYDRKIVSNEMRTIVASSNELEKSPCTQVTSTGVQETNLDALFDDEIMGFPSVQEGKVTEETVENRTSLLRKTFVNRNGKVVVHSSKEDHMTNENTVPSKSVPVVGNNQEVPIIRADPLNESTAFEDLDDDVFTQTPGKPGVNQNGYHGDGTYSSDADSETSSLNSFPLKPKNRHTRSSLEAVKSAVRPKRSSLSSDSSSATPVPSERNDLGFDPFQPLPGSTSTDDRSGRDFSQKTDLAGSRKATMESGHNVRQITASGNGLIIDSDGAAQRITRAYSESLVGVTEFHRSAFTPVRDREKGRRSNSQGEHILSGIQDEQETVCYNDSDPDRNTEAATFKDMANRNKSMPDLHKPHNEIDAQPKSVPYHSRLSAHTRLWLSQTAGIDTSSLCKDDSVGSEIFLYPSNRFQPGKSVDASFLSTLSDTDDVDDDVSTRPSSPMSEFSFAGEAPFGGDFLGDVIVVTCGNGYCGKDEIVRSHDKTSFTSCPSCFTYYCSNECRRAHWREHKKVCYFGRINSYMRSFVYFCHKKENLQLLLSKIATKNFGSKGRGSVMVTFASPKQSRKFMTSGCVLLPSPPSYSTIRDLQKEGVVSKHKVSLIQQVRDYDPNQEFVLNLAIVAGRVDDLPLYPVPRHKLSTVLQCVKIPLSESLVQKPKTIVPDTNKVTKVFYLPKCSRHEFVNDMEARRHYCRNISKGLKQYGIRMKKDYPEAYDSLCLYVEKNIPFKPLTVYGNKDSRIIVCKIMPEGHTSTSLI